MNQYYLKFKDKSDLESTLISVGLAEIQPIFGTENDTQFVSKVELDIIGLIYKPTGKALLNQDGLQYPEMTAMEGYHANMKAELTAEQEKALPLISEPKNPKRVWA